MKPQYNNEALRGYLCGARVTGREAAHRLGITEATFSRKLRGHFAFRQGEIANLVCWLEIPPQEIKRCFFTQLVQKR